MSAVRRLALAAVLCLAIAPSGATLQSDGGPAPSFLKDVGGKLFFATYEPAGWRLWTSDGTAAGTVSLAAGLGLDVELVAVDETLVFSTRGALWKSDGTPAGTTVVANLPFYPNGIKAVAGGVYFSNGQGQLWHSDLTGAGTTLVADIDPGYEFHDLTPAAITNVKGHLFFRAIDLAHGNELWADDGTPGGAHVIDINPIAGSAPGFFLGHKGRLYFSADDGTNGYELWASDGTTTVEVAEINPTGDAWPTNLRAVGDTIFFSADDGSGAELWKTKGTAGTTARVADINPTGGSYPNALLNVGGTLYFRADDGTTGIELWKSDGTAAGTTRVADLNPTGSSVPASLHQVNGRLFFTADDGAHGEELWTSDGTAAGTVIVADLNPHGSSQPHYLTVVDDVLYFAADDGETGTQLWTLDCGSGGWPCTPRVIALPTSPRAPGGVPFLVKDIAPGPQDGEPYYLAAVGNRLFFQAFRPDTGIEVWTSDGTEAGTRLVRDLNPGPADSRPWSFTDVNGIAFFLAESPAYGSGLWKSDGTEAGTTLVHDDEATSYEHVTIADLTPFKGALYYRVNQPTGGGIWRADPSAGGAELVIPAHDVESLAVVRDTLYFIAPDPQGFGYAALWRSDGTTTNPVNLRALPKPGKGRGQLTAAGSYLFFRAASSLWRSDGTMDGTISLPADDPRDITAVGDTVFFTSTTAVLGPNGAEYPGRELWKSDGTPEGTVLVADINPGPADGKPGRLTNVNGTLFFWATDGVTGFELWASDGTTPGTRLVRDIDPTNVTVPSYFQAVGDLLYFTAHTPSFGYELWRSDGTFDGTRIVKNINLVRSSYPESPANVGGTLFFYADDGRVGEELWALTPCGDGVLQPGEECDDANLANGDGCSEHCRIEHESDCGNCTDDDRDGLVDLEDPDCCAAEGTLAIERLRLGKRRLGLAGSLTGMDLGSPDPSPHDVTLQVHAGGTALCAHVPAGKLRVGDRALRFVDPKATLADAHGILRLALRRRKNGTVRLAAAGKVTGLDRAAGSMSLVLGLGDGVAMQCAAATANVGRRRGAP